MKNALVIALLIYPLLNSTVPPEAYELQPKVAGEIGQDVTLSAWLTEFKDNGNIFDLDIKKFTSSIKEFDPITQTYLRLRYVHVNSFKNQSLQEKALNLALGQSSSFASHPLKPYFYEELLESEKLDPVKRDLIMKKLTEEGANSCPHKQVLLKDIESDGFKSRSVGEIKKTIATISGFRSNSFKKQAVEEIIDVLNEDTVDALIPELKGLVQKVPSLDIPEDVLEKFEMEFVSAGYSQEMQDLADYLRTTVRKRQCYKAKSQLLSSIHKVKDLESLSKAEPLIAKVESCYRSKGSRSRLSYWKSISSSLKKAYSYEGEMLALKKQGAIYWLIDDFKKAKEVFNQIKATAKERQDKDLEGYAIYTLGRVCENEGDDLSAIAHYKEYAEKFSAGKNLDDVYMSLVLLNFHVKDYTNSLAYANRIISSQQTIPEDDRNGGALSFAYFWAGRAALRLDKSEMALAMWRRVASEYYSTFYGAMGHFMYEQSNGTEYKLEPSRSTTFRPEAFLARFGYDDRKILDRATILLKAGLKEDANCEIMELMTETDKDNDRVLMKSLLLFASGDWLESIKSYASLPRYYRGALPAGFERLLFPKAYANDVEEFATKLNLESAIIYGIIRQESVFNPKASSPAGARGLMQLMPATAKYESKRLSNSYLPYKTRQQLQVSMRNRANLYRPRDNIAIGVHHVYRLLKKYKNPVFVLTSYNANPKATERWKKSMSTEDLLTFMERIPYQETRLYVKLVLRNYFFYKKWYENGNSQYPYLQDIVEKDVAIVQSKNKKG